MNVLLFAQVCDGEWMCGYINGINKQIRVCE